MNSETTLRRRRSIRLKDYDYSQPGAFFVTLVTGRCKEIFGHIEQGRLTPSSLGKIVQEEWIRSEQIRREVQLYEDEFVLMPNHIHGIVWIVDLVGAENEEAARRAPLRDTASANPPVRADGIRPNAEGRAHHMPLREGRSLASFIAGYKASVTARAKRELNIANIWQRNYYEHIIRTETAYRNIWNYIDANPQKWDEDRFFLNEKPIE